VSRFTPGPLGPASVSRFTPGPLGPASVSRFTPAPAARIPAVSGWRERLDEIGDRHGLDRSRPDRLARLPEPLRDDPTAPPTVQNPDEAVDVHVADSLVALDLEVVRE